MENENNPILITAKEKLAGLQAQKEQLEQSLVTAKSEIHQAALGVLGSDGNQPLDSQAEKIAEFVQFHQADAPWFYATLNSIMRTRMLCPSYNFLQMLETKIEIPDDQFGLSRDADLQHAMAYAYHGGQDLDSGIPDAIKSLKFGYQKWAESERIYKVQYNPRRPSIVFQWLGENVNTLAYFGQLSFEARKKYLPES